LSKLLGEQTAKKNLSAELGMLNLKGGIDMYKSPNQLDVQSTESVENSSAVDSIESETPDGSKVKILEQSSDANAPLLVNLRWQVVILGLNYMMPMTIARHLDPVMQGFVNFLMSTVIGGVGAGLIYLFFTVSSKGNFLRNQRWISIVITIGIIIGAWLDWKRNNY
jgi:hypothetical protein